MVNRPAIAGVRQITPSAGFVPVEEALDRLGRNTGNMMFTESLSSIIVKNKPVSYQLSEDELSDRDAIVFAAANWINPHGDFGKIAERIEKTDLPVFAVGVGAQASLNKEIPRVTAGTLRFLKIISERSKTISTRGVFSCEVLEHYGIKNSVPTGCPSLLMTGKSGIQYFQTASLDRVTLHGTRHGFSRADGFQDLFYKEAYLRGYDILLQSETADILAATQDGTVPAKLADAGKFVREAYNIGNDTAAVAYLKSHGKYFTDYNSWIEYMKTRTFCVGTRIHGTIASLIAGTPAILVAHDSRTLELAKTMGVPYVLPGVIENEEFLNMDRFIELFNEQSLKSVHKVYVDNFEAFFYENEITIKL